MSPSRRSALRPPDESRAHTVGRMARYRNRMVQFYDDIAEQELFDIVTTRLGDVEETITAMTGWAATHRERGAADE